MINFYKNSFIKKVLMASEALDTLIYLNSNSFETALSRWISDLTSELSACVNRYKRRKAETVSSHIIDLNEKILEKKHQDYLNYLFNFVEDVDQILNRKALQFAKICDRFDKAKKAKDTLIKEQGIPYLTQLDIALDLISKFSNEHLKKIERLKINSLPKYQNIFSRLIIFRDLSRVKFLTSKHLPVLKKSPDKIH